MAAVAGRSVSVFHSLFKAITGLSPLQYQKQSAYTTRVDA